MGNSTKHASTVPLVLNPKTGAITAQFHVVFDDWFATVTSTENELLNLNSDEWKHMFGESTYQHPLDDDDGADDSKFLGLEPLTSGHSSHSSPAKRSLSRRENVARAIDTTCPPVPLPVEISPVVDCDTSPPLPHAAAPIRDDTPATAPVTPVVSTLVSPTVGWTEGEDITTSSGAVVSDEGDVSTEGAIKSAAVVSSEGEYSGTADEGKSAACVHSNLVLNT
jgi:hypothetical protein